MMMMIRPTVGVESFQVRLMGCGLEVRRLMCGVRISGVAIQMA